MMGTLRALPILPDKKLAFEVAHLAAGGIPITGYFLSPIPYPLHAMDMGIHSIASPLNIVMGKIEGEGPDMAIDGREIKRVP